MSAAEHRELLAIALTATLAAGPPILDIYRAEIAVRHKEDRSPVTQADERAEAVILDILARETPEIASVAEESVARASTSGAAPKRYWVIDPLDGTKEFIARNGEFTVNVALIEGHAPVLGVVFSPALDIVWAGAGPGSARQRSGGGNFQPIAARPVPAHGAIVLHSRSHADEDKLGEFCAQHPGATRAVSGSSIKFCRLAAGEADLYPRFGTTMEWDTAAGQAVLEAAGGSVIKLDGARLDYGKPAFRNPDFIARGRI
jgi:3'(2'), 5'-bisphosphate nucleotidase